MDVILCIAGVLLVVMGQMKVSRNSKPWPESKRNGRIIGGLFMLPIIIEYLIIFFKNN
jgi:hypothetical protein